jgi:spermidine dehydrogenase
MPHDDPAQATPGEVTRRDFVGGSLIGSGATLLSMAAPAALVAPQAKAQTTGLPMTGLGADWTGPGGGGDYAGFNGNTHQVVNAAHGAIRNQQMDPKLDSAKATGEIYDVVVVGAGISGLCAAYVVLKQKPDAKVLVLDQHGIFGGEAKANVFEVDGHHLEGPQGSTGIVVPFRLAKPQGMWTHWATELGYPEDFVYQKASNTSQPIKVPEDIWTPMMIAPERSDTAFFYEGAGMVKNPWSNGFKHAPISDKARVALMEVELFRTPPVRDDWEKWLDSMTYKQFLLDVVGVDPAVIDEVTAYYDPIACCMGCGLGCDVISAYSAYNFLMPGTRAYYRYQNGGGDPTETTYLATFPGGNAIAARKFLKMSNPAAIEGENTLYDVWRGKVVWDALDRPGQPHRLRLQSTVVEVRHEGRPDRASHARVTYMKDGALYRVHARAVICAGQQHANKHICRDLPPEYLEAMNAFAHASILTLNIALRNWRFLDKMGVACVRWFEGFGWWTGLRRNLIIDGHETQPLDPDKPVVLTQYIPFPQPGVPFPQCCTAARMQLFSMPFADIEAATRDQLTKMFGPYGFDWDRDVAGVVANRQGHAYFVGAPGFFFGKDGKPAPKDVLRTPYHRIAFSHSELAGAQMWETAAEEGERAAKQVLALL